MKTTICDLCANTSDVNEDHQMDVIFITEQTEGRLTDHYITRQKLDICEPCLDAVTRKKSYIIAEGAQGYNTYRIHEDQETKVLIGKLKSALFKANEVLSKGGYQTFEID